MSNLTCWDNFFHEVRGVILVIFRISKGRIKVFILRLLNLNLPIFIHFLLKLLIVLIYRHIMHVDEALVVWLFIIHLLSILVGRHIFLAIYLKLFIWVNIIKVFIIIFLFVLFIIKSLCNRAFFSSS